MILIAVIFITIFVPKLVQEPTFTFHRKFGSVSQVFNHLKFFGTFAIETKLFSTKTFDFEICCFNPYFKKISSGGTYPVRTPPSSPLSSSFFFFFFFFFFSFFISRFPRGG